MKLFICAAFQLLFFYNVYSQNSLKGKISDSKTGELLVGATVKEGNQNTIAGLDGTFNLKNITPGKHCIIFYFTRTPNS